MSLWFGLPLIAAIGLMVGISDLAPALQAKAGNGTPGVFTAVHEECTRRNCDWLGDFVADDGGSSRADVRLYDAPDSLKEGDTVPARDTGARKGVYAAAGGWSWLLVTGLVLGGLIAAVVWVALIVRAVRRRRARNRPVHA